jgi:hypothetical protein
VNGPQRRDLRLPGTAGGSPRWCTMGAGGFALWVAEPGLSRHRMRVTRNVPYTGVPSPRGAASWRGRGERWT